MPRDSSGNYTLPSGNPVVTGTTIASSWGNATMGDIATEITDSLDRSGKGGMLAILKVFDGSVTTPGIGFASEPGTGIYRPAAQEWAVSISGVQEFLITTTGFTILGAGIITTPSVSSVALTVNSSPGVTGIAVVGPAGHFAAIQFNPDNSSHFGFIGAAGTTGDIASDSVIGDTVLRSSTGIRLNTNNGGASAVSINGQGNFLLNAPGSGIAAVINGVNAQQTLQINSGNSGTTGAPDLYITRAGSTANTIAEGPNIQLSDSTNNRSTILQNSGGQTELWQFNGSAWNQIYKILASNGFILNAPASGRALAVTAFAGVHPIIMTDSTGTSGPLNVGYLEVPQNLQTGNYTCVLADSGKAIDMNGTGLTATIPANSAVAYPIGTCLTFTNLNASSLSIAITTDTLVRAGSTSTGTRTLLQNGMATARKVSATGWFISGTGLT